MLDYDEIKSLLNQLSVATKDKRIAKLKENLMLKKASLDMASASSQVLIEREIMMLKVSIADLV
jgi:hypothetical protein